MNPEAILQQIAVVVRDTVSCGPVDITRETRALDVKGWDSLSQTMILLRLEDTFKITLPVERAITLANVGELTDLVAELVSKT